MLALSTSAAACGARQAAADGAASRRSAAAGHRLAPSPATPLRAQRRRAPARRAAPPPAALFSGSKSSAEAKPAAPPGAGKEEYYEVFLPKPIGVKFARGRDGGAYIASVSEQLGSVDSNLTVGDKVVKVSASFGGDVWEALNFGQVVYAIKTRNGDVYMKLKKNFGDLSQLEEEVLTEAEKQFRAERGGGNYGAGTKEMQARNYVARKEADRRRRELFDDALSKFRGGKVEEALIDFENVLGLEPKNYVGDNFSRVTQVYRYTQYNVACCYATLGQVEPGLEALNAALGAGFEDFAKVRSDPNLEGLRKSPKFKTIIDAYDEPIINEGAIKALKSIFSFGKKD